MWFPWFPSLASPSSVPLLSLFLFFIRVSLVIFLFNFLSLSVSLFRLGVEPPWISEGSSDPEESPPPSPHLSVCCLHGLSTLLHHHRADGERQPAHFSQRWTSGLFYFCEKLSEIHALGSRLGWGGKTFVLWLVTFLPVMVQTFEGVSFNLGEPHTLPVYKVNLHKKWQFCNKSSAHEGYVLCF